VAAGRLRPIAVHISTSAFSGLTFVTTGTTVGTSLAPPVAKYLMVGSCMRTRDTRYISRAGPDQFTPGLPRTAGVTPNGHLQGAPVRQESTLSTSLWLEIHNASARLFTCIPVVQRAILFGAPRDCAPRTGPIYAAASKDHQRAQHRSIQGGLPAGVNSSGITAQPATELAPLPYKETTRNCDFTKRPLANLIKWLS
jgi:hypothetical protein